MPDEFKEILEQIPIDMAGEESFVTRRIFFAARGHCLAGP